MHRSTESDTANALDALIGAHYANQRMPRESATRILEASALHHRKERIWLRRMVAAIAMLAVGFGVLHVHLERRAEADIVLREIALNHREDHGADVYVNTYSELVSALDRIGLPDALPGALGEEFKVVGGRYCSVRGRLAAKLMLRQLRTGDNFSLFATQRTPALERIGEFEVVTDGVDVRAWSAQNMFFALARSIGS